MTTNATITENNTRRQASLRRNGLRYRDITKRALTIAVLVMIVSLPITRSISTVDVARSPRVDLLHVARDHLSVYSLPHLPHTTDSIFDAWEKHLRNRSLHRSMQSVLFNCELGNLCNVQHPNV